MNLRDADIQQAVKTAADAPGIPGLVVMVAGGNSNSDAYPFSPAFVPLAMTVGSTTITDSRATFSNSSSRTDMCALGSDVKSTGRRNPYQLPIYRSCPRIARPQLIRQGTGPSGR